MCAQLTLWDTDRFTSSQVSAVGASRRGLQGGPMIGRYGQAPAHASLSASQASSAEPQMSGTYGPSCATSSASADLQSSLESRLRVALEGNGSPLYGMTWKRWDMRSGPPICALRASALRTSDSAYTGERSGWPTPDASVFEAANMERLMERRQECRARHGNGNGFGLTLGQAVTLLCSGLAHGSITDGSCAPTDERGRLHPSHAGWMMGYPPEWDSCGAMAMQSCRRSRPPSSRRSRGSDG